VLRWVQKGHWSSKLECAGGVQMWLSWRVRGVSRRGTEDGVHTAHRGYIPVTRRQTCHCTPHLLVAPAITTSNHQHSHHHYLEPIATDPCNGFTTEQSSLPPSNTVLRTLFVRVIYLFITKIILWSTVIKKKRQEIHWSMLNAHWARWKATLYFMEFTPALAATVESLVAGQRMSATLY